MEATPEQIAGYKAEAQSVTQADGSVRYYIRRTQHGRNFMGGMRLTDCCAAVSTYMDDGAGGQELSCKACYHEVDNGQGDGDQVLNANGTITGHGDRSITISLDTLLATQAVSA
ncbi:MAG: hypothetical protein HOE75_01545 [Chloroflexi bacterium]|nr:hypothetical protein [Chloroflexota bacterium]